MVNFDHLDPLRAVIVLDREVSRARAVLQRTSEVDAAFERRVAALIELVSRRDLVLAGSKPHPAAVCAKLPPA